MKLSANFKLEEFERSQIATRADIDNHASAVVVENLARLCEEVLQPIRDHFGAAYVSSGYRCAELNRRIGGAQNSQHVIGQAADIVVAGVTPVEVCEWVMAESLPFDQLIYEGAWTHVSFSPAARAEVLTANFENGRARYSTGLAA